MSIYFKVLSLVEMRFSYKNILVAIRLAKAEIMNVNL